VENPTTVPESLTEVAWLLVPPGRVPRSTAKMWRGVAGVVVVAVGAAEAGTPASSKAVAAAATPAVTRALDKDFILIKYGS
jgi:hypothetical protein